MTYEERVEYNLKECNHVSTGLCPGCEECRDTYAPDATMSEFEELWSGGDVPDEGVFSWSRCGICDSRLGGDRYVWHYVDDNGNIIHCDDCCVDCVFYLEYGEVPEFDGLED